MRDNKLLYKNELIIFLIFVFKYVIKRNLKNIMYNIQYFI